MDTKDLTEFESLFLTLIGEARGEPIESQVGCGCVIRNRLYRYPARYKSYKDVCLEPLQFSCWNEHDPNRTYLLELADELMTGQPLKDFHLKQCIFVATGIKDGAIIDNTGGALNYVEANLFNSPDRPKWTKNVTQYVQRGHHIFFTAV